MFGRTLLYLYELRKNLRLEPSRLQALQCKSLRTMIKHAYQNVPFYRRKFDSAGIKPRDIRTIEDLAKVPITTKREIQAASLNQTVAGNVNLSNCVKRMTSGSTGIPLTIFADTRTIDFENALAVRTYLENGMKPWHRMIRFTEPRNLRLKPHWFQRIGLMRTEYASIFDDREKQLSLIKKFKPDVVRGYVSCLEILAHFCKDNGKNVSPKLVFTSAELLDREARDVINSAFGIELFDLYVSAEFGLMAWECVEHHGYHINVESLLLEIVRNGEVLGPNERGEVICTSLINKTMPLIRYEIGDVGSTFDEQCTCEANLPLLKIIDGRTGDFLVATSGRIIPPVIFFPYPFEDVTWIKQFRIIQESREKMVFQIAIKKDGLKQVEDHLKGAQAKMKQLFGEDMDIRFRIVEKMQADATGKLRKIISHVPVNMGEIEKAD